jgi:hypothetical protein
VTKFRHLPAVGRAIIVAVAVGVFAIAVVACATSYNAIYRLVDQLGLYGYRTTQSFPLLLDAAFLVAELAAILGGIMRAVTRSDEVSQGWPGVTMVLCGLGTIGFNVAHAYLIGGRGDPLTVWRCVVASLPPVLMILAFQCLLAIVKWVMLHLGRPLNSAAVLSPTTVPGYGPGYGLVPPGFGTVPPGVPNPGWAWGQMPSSTSSENGQNGRPVLDGNGAGDQADTLKRQWVQTYLAGLSPEQLARLTGDEIAADLKAQGMEVSGRYARQILDEWRAAARQASAVRKPRRT